MLNKPPILRQVLSHNFHCYLQLALVRFYTSGSQKVLQWSLSVQLYDESSFFFLLHRLFLLLYFFFDVIKRIHYSIFTNNTTNNLTTFTVYNDFYLHTKFPTIAHAHGMLGWIHRSNMDSLFTGEKLHAVH